MTPATASTSGRPRAAALALFGALLVGVLAAPASARPAQAPPSGSTTSTLPPTLEGESGDLKAQYDEITGKEAQLLQDVSDAQLARIKAAGQYEALNRQTQAKQIQLLAAQGDLQAAEAAVELRIAARKKAERAVRASRERLRKQIVAAYVTGGETGGVVEAFLNSQDGNDVSKALAYGHAVSGRSEELVRDLERSEAKRAKAAKAARRAKDRAVKARDEISLATQFLVDARKEQGKLLEELNKKLFVEASLLRQVQGQKALVEGHINSVGHASDGVAMILAALQADQPDWLPGTVEITNPLPGVKVSSPFGMRHHPILGIDRLHAGADLGAPTGTPIHAAADGVVVLAEVRGGYGNAVVIDHGNSLATLYGHTSKMLVVAGQQVKRGDIIALVGSTGLSTGPHCHFETRIKGMPINPEGVIDFNARVDYEQQLAN